MTLQEVVARREALLQRINEQRQVVAAQSEPLRHAAEVFDKGYAIARTIRRAPPVLVIGTGLLAFALIRKRQSVVRIMSAALTAARWWLVFKSRSQHF